MTTELILNEIEKNKDHYIEFLREIIQTESYNPPGNEKNVALKIQDYLKTNGIKSEIFPFGENRANLIAYLNNNFEQKTLLYNGHMDVVPPGSLDSWKYPPLSGYIKRNKKMFGRGTTDMKSGLIAMAISATILKKLSLDIKGNLIYCAVADEETGGKLGTKWCLENPLKEIRCDFSVVGEATGFTPLPYAIILGEKGHLIVKIVAKGISCHAWGPFMGKNPIYMINKLINSLEDFKKYIPQIEPPLSEEELKSNLLVAFPNKEIFERIYNEQPLLKGIVKAMTQYTYSVTMINSGIKDNVVPEKCEITIDFRLLPGQTSEIILNGLKKLIADLGYNIKEELKGESDEIFFYIETKIYNEPSIWENWEDSKPLETLINSFESVFKKKPILFLAPGMTDAHFIRNMDYCQNTVDLGPGTAQNYHVINENVDLLDFINMIKVYTLFAYNFLK